VVIKTHKNAARARYELDTSVYSNLFICPFCFLFLFATVKVNKVVQFVKGKEIAVNLNVICC